jgi:hypothetical protein
MDMGADLELAGFRFSADEWTAYDDATRVELMRCGTENAPEAVEDEPTRPYWGGPPRDSITG